MKTAKLYRLPSDEYQVVLVEGDVEVCVTYTATETAARKIAEDWKKGTYQLLQG